MKMEQKITALGAILVILISCAYSEDEDCPSSPCCENKPKLGPDDKLELGLIFEQNEEGSQEVVDLSEHICKLMETCGEQISMIAIPGALVKVIASYVFYMGNYSVQFQPCNNSSPPFREENGEISCPEDFCFGDQDQVCSAMKDPEYGTSCKENSYAEEIQECIDTKTDEINQILIENGKNREKLGIPECRVPALTFNGVFDLCANISSYDDLLNYVCELYENQLNCCNN